MDHLFFHVLAGKYNSRAVKVNFPSKDTILSISIFTAKGRLIRKLNKTSAGSRGIVWDGRDSHGSYVQKGSYLIEIKGKVSKGSGKIIVG